MASGIETIRQAAARVNASLMDYVVSLADEGAASEASSQAPSRIPTSLSKETAINDRRESGSNNRASMSSSKEPDAKRDADVQTPPPPYKSPTPTPQSQPHVDLDYAAAVQALTLLFLNDHEATRVAALTWLLMLHRKAPRKVSRRFFLGRYCH